MHCLRWLPSLLDHKPSRTHQHASILHSALLSQRSWLVRVAWSGRSTLGSETILSYMCCTTCLTAEAAPNSGEYLAENCLINVHQHELSAALQVTIALTTKLHAAHGEIDSTMSLFLTIQCLWFIHSNVFVQIPP